MEKKFVSIVLYLHNNEESINFFLKNAFSLIKSSFEHCELICIDDYCTDKTITHVKEYFKNEATNNTVTIVKMGTYQGLEASMNAGRDISIGDFVFEFDSTLIDYETDLILNAYDSVSKGFDIAIVAPSKNKSLSSALFYNVFNAFSKNGSKICSDSFRLLSRRSINRIISISDFVPYRKALYANCGLKSETITYRPLKNVKYNSEKKANERLSLAFDSFVYFTNFLECVSTAISAFFLLSTIGFIIYAIWDYFTNKSIADGWTSIICFLSFGFFGIFVLLTIILKYLSVIVNLIFRRQKYVVESVENLGGEK